MSILNMNNFGEILRTKRGDATPKISQPALARQLLALGVDPSSQGTLSRVEGGDIDFRKTWPDPEHRLQILELYGFTHNELVRLDDKFDLGIGPYLLLAGTTSLSGPAAADLDHVGTVSAGNGGSAVMLRQKSVSAPSWVAEKKLDPANIFVAEVDGDSMTCEIVAKTIPQGARAYFHRPNEKMRPEPGRIVYVYLQAEDTAVLKIYQPGSQFTVLRSSNPTAAPIIVDEANPGIVQGIYLAHEVLRDDLR